MILKTTNLMLTLNINHRLTKHHNSFVSRFTAMQPSRLASHPLDSGFSDDEHVSSTSRTESLTRSDQHSSANIIDQSDQNDYIVAIASNDDFGEYVEISLNSEMAPPLPKRWYTEDDNPSKPPTERPQLDSQGIEQRTVDISLENEKALPLPKRGCIEDENPSKPPTERPQLDSQGIEQRTVDISLESEKALPLPKRGRIEDENPSKPPTELHQLAPQGIEQRIVDISLESEKAPPLPKRGCIEDENPSKPPTERPQLDSQGIEQPEKNTLEKSDCDKTVDRHERSVDKPTKATERDNFGCDIIACMSYTQLSELLKTCTLDRFADTCVEQSIDGEIFMELTDDMLKDEPFQLKQFEILKVNKIKQGWKPKK
jgi:hypothetical protein